MTKIILIDGEPGHGPCRFCGKVAELRMGACFACVMADCPHPPSPMESYPMSNINANYALQEAEDVQRRYAARNAPGAYGIPTPWQGGHVSINWWEEGVQHTASGRLSTEKAKSLSVALVELSREQREAERAEMEAVKSEHWENQRNAFAPAPDAA